MISAAVALALPPMIRSQAHLEGVGKFSLVLDSPPWLSVCLVVGAVLIIILDWLSHHRRMPPAALANPSPVQASPPVADPCYYTGMVEVYVDGTVWRASMHTGSAAQADPVCPTHHVLMETRPGDRQGINWYCNNRNCSYHRMISRLSILSEYDGRRQYLAFVYSEIERQVREGTGYQRCGDDGLPAR